jgi:MerR family redox-sensitive transcriptional activator SoxR
MVASADEMTIGEVAARSGIATSALRFYESQGLLEALRTPGNQRRYSRSVLRRVALIRAAQAVGVTLHEIRSALDALPERRTPTKRDWERLSAHWRRRLDDRIATLQRIRDDLTGCIGCGCLSLRSCALFNRDDLARKKGPGSSLLRG